jgi:hypothetical protein
LTLLLTCVTHDFVVQASDRRLTFLDGRIAEEVANKATLFGNAANFAFTGLARCSHRETSDELLMRCLSAPNLPLVGLLEGLAKSAARDIRNLPLRVRPRDRRAVRRTSFVGAGYVGVKDPGRYNLPNISDDLHAFLCVVSNAQDLSEAWREESDQEFSVHLGWLPSERGHMLHVAGQSLLPHERVGLERGLRKALGRVAHPEPIARLLTRAVRQVSARNVTVGPNVMCTMTRRANVRDQGNIDIGGGLVPITHEYQSEASYFQRARGGPSAPARWIYSPADPSAENHYGPNYASSVFMMKGMHFGRVPSASS